MISDAVERFVGALRDPPDDQQILVEILRRLAAVADSPDTALYAVAAAVRELRATAGELRGLARPGESKRDRFAFARARADRGQRSRRVPGGDSE